MMWQLDSVSRAETGKSAGRRGIVVGYSVSNFRFGIRFLGLLIAFSAFCNPEAARAGFLHIGFEVLETDSAGNWNGRSSATLDFAAAGSIADPFATEESSPEPLLVEIALPSGEMGSGSGASDPSPVSASGITEPGFSHVSPPSLVSWLNLSQSLWIPAAPRSGLLRPPQFVV